MMKKAFLAFPLFGILIGCPPALNPLSNIADKLDVKVDEIEPHLRIQIPPNRSSLDITIHLSIESSASFALGAQSFSGTLGIEHQGATQAITNIKVSKGFDIPARGRASIPITLNLTYDDIKNSWEPINRAARDKSATWKLEGNLQATALGLSVNIPVRATKTTGF
jgi:hypothetical protein